MVDGSSCGEERNAWRSMGCLPSKRPGDGVGWGEICGCAEFRGPLPLTRLFPIHWNDLLNFGRGDFLRFRRCVVRGGFFVICYVMSQAFEFGPKMLALTEMQRRFVLAMASDPLGSRTRWARQAGYSDVKDGARVRAFEVFHNEAVQEAILEYSRGLLNTVGPILATHGLLEMARKPKGKKYQRAVEMLANRVGLHETTEHVVNVNHTDRTTDAVVERIKQMAAALGVDPAQLLGLNAAPKQIEGEVIEGKTS